MISNLDTDLAKQIIRMWENNAGSKQDIARHLGCSEAHVSRITRDWMDHKRATLPPLPLPKYDPVTPRLVVQAYFDWAPMTPLEIARRLRADPETVLGIIHKRGLPYIGGPAYD